MAKVDGSGESKNNRVIRITKFPFKYTRRYFGCIRGVNIKFNHETYKRSRGPSSGITVVAKEGVGK